MQVDSIPTLEQVLTALRGRSRLVKLETIADATGVSVPWLNKVLSGEIKQPSYERVCAVYIYLKESAAN